MSKILMLDAEPLGVEGLQLLLAKIDPSVTLCTNLGNAISRFQKTDHALLIAEPHHICISEDESQISQLRNFLEYATKTSQVMLLTTMDMPILREYGLNQGTHYQHYSQKPELPRRIENMVKEILSGNP